MDALRRMLFRTLGFFAFACTLLSSVFFASTPVEAAATSMLSYQAKLADSSGNPLADGAYSMKFTIYNDSSVALWTAAGSLATPSAITVYATGSLVSVRLGDAGQNSLATVDWSGGQLYLGVTIGSDTEMTPLRRITSVPQAFFADNANTLQGMYASSTAYGGQSLFTIHQTQTSAATSTRTALEVRSAGMSNANDYLFRAVNSSSTAVFALDRQGSVTSTGALSLGGSFVGPRVSSTNIQASNTTSTKLGVSGSALFGGRVVSGIDAAMAVTELTSFQPADLDEARNLQIVGSRMFVQGTSTISQIDISDPTAPRRLSFLSPGGPIGGFSVRGNMLYVAYELVGTGRYLGIYDVTNPTTFAAIGTLSLADFTSLSSGAQVIITGKTAYILGFTDTKLVTVDISTPSTPVRKSAIALSEAPVRAVLAPDGIIYYVADGSGASTIRKVLLTDPLYPQEGAAISSLGDYATDLVIRDRTAYVSTRDSGALYTIDLTTFSIVTSTATQNTRRIYENGGKLFVYMYDLPGVRVYDTASSTAPALLGSFQTSFVGELKSFAQYGDVLFYGYSGDPYITAARLPGIQVNSLSGGTGSFYSLRATGDANVAGRLDVGGGIVVGSEGLLSTGISLVTVSATTSSVLSVINQAPDDAQSSWGLFTNRLLVGDQATATGTATYVGMVGYNSASAHFGLCLDNTSTASTCIDFGATSTVYSLLADDAIGANAFDLAERYAISGEAEPGDVLVLDQDEPMHMKKSPGIEYDTALSGVVSTRPGFLLGTGGGASVALVGRVPVKVSVLNGSIAVGDPLTSSAVPGRAMKATRAGTIIGRALEAANADGVIEVYLQPGFDASALLQSDGSLTTIAQDVGVRAQDTASASQSVFDSQSVRFLGSAWNGVSPVVSEFQLFNDVRSATSSLFTIAQGTSSLFTVDQEGSLSVMKDLVVGGKLYPSARGRAQQESYLFLDDSEEGSRYMSTNADGWQSMDGYDYAERYTSPDALEAGDVVAVRRGSRVYVQRSLSETDVVVGIVSTKPGFIAGRPQEDAYPIALAGRVPTKVSSMNGAINAGDTLAPSSIPGVAVKAIKPGPTLGVALEEYAGGDVGMIEVFVNAGWWGGDGSRVADSGTQRAQGFAQITMGATKAHIFLNGFVRYPNIQVTPYTQIETGWWIDNVGPEGFDLFLGAPLGRQARFAWQAEEVSNDPMITLSSGLVFSIDPVTGGIQYPPGKDETSKPKNPIVVPEPVETEAEQVPNEEEVSPETVLPSSETEGEVEPVAQEPFVPGTEEPAPQVDAPAAESPSVEPVSEPVTVQEPVSIPVPAPMVDASPVSAPSPEPATE